MQARFIAGLLSIGMALSGAMAIGQSGSGDGLYPGESVETAAGYPAITRFIAGEPDGGLVVFVPGAHHAARVSYGGHDGSYDANFLGHQLAERGQNFLAVSYPIDLAEGGLDEAYPDFTHRDWGRQVAAATARTLADQRIEGDFTVFGWSMAGRSAQSVHEALGEEGIELSLFVSLAATPALPGLITLSRDYPILPSGYVDRRANCDGWWQQVAAMSDAAGHQIVPEDVFKAEYQGDIPITIQAYGQVSRDGTVERDPAFVLEDTKPFAFEDCRLIGAVIPNNPAKARHALVDRAARTLDNANTLHMRHLGDTDPRVLDSAHWEALREISDELPDRLARRVDGNHFFLGEPGAAATTATVVDVQDAAKTLKDKVNGAIGL